MAQTPNVTIEPFGAYVLARVTTDIGASTYRGIDDALSEALARTRTALIIDLSHVHNCGSHGAHTLARLNRQATGRGISVIVTGVHHGIARLLDIMSLDQSILTQPDPDTAAQWLDRGTASINDAIL